MKRQVLFSAVSLVALIVLGTISAVSSAATITAAGSVVDDLGGQITNWKTTAVGKPLDIDFDNVYGTLADLMYLVRYKQGPGPAFSFDGSDGQVGPFAGYASVDDPAGEPYAAVGPPDIQVRTTSDGGTTGTGNAHDMFVFTVLTNATPKFRLGIVSDALDGSGFSPTSTGLRQLGGPSNVGASASLISNANNTPDMNFFDVRGAVAGDQFAVWGIGGSFGFVTHSIVTWDVIPEPSSLTLLSLGLLGMMRVARRRK